jgi:hypothetical protein
MPWYFLTTSERLIPEKPKQCLPLLGECHKQNTDRKELSKRNGLWQTKTTSSPEMEALPCDLC